MGTCQGGHVIYRGDPFLEDSPGQEEDVDAADAKGKKTDSILGHHFV